MAAEALNPWVSGPRSGSWVSSCNFLQDIKPQPATTKKHGTNRILIRSFMMSVQVIKNYGVTQMYQFKTVGVHNQIDLLTIGLSALIKNQRPDATSNSTPSITTGIL